MLVVCAGLCNLQPTLINDIDQEDTVDEATLDQDIEIECDTENDIDDTYAFEFGETGFD